jgi:A/G-specific adenine glycosylase
VTSDPKSAATLKRLWSSAEELLPPGNAGAFNQALMDLGATICTPRAPKCESCPLEKLCEARARGEESALPLKTKRKPVPHEDVVVGIVRKRDRILIDQRKPEGLLGGLWEFPGGKPEKGETLRDALVREVREELGIQVEAGRHLLNVRHAYTHLRVTLHAFEATWMKGRTRAIGCQAFRWIRPARLDDFAFPAATLRIIKTLRRRGVL